jgi:hypothetical protein
MFGPKTDVMPRCNTPVARNANGALPSLHTIGYEPPRVDELIDVSIFGGLVEVVISTVLEDDPVIAIDRQHWFVGKSCVFDSREH